MIYDACHNCSEVRQLERQCERLFDEIEKLREELANAQMLIKQTQEGQECDERADL